MKLQTRVAEAERICGHRFENQGLLVSALTHPSAAEGRPVSASYERLEFLGDSILGAIVATDLFERFPEMDEGALTQAKISLVSGKMLSSVGERLGLAPLIVMGESERGTGERGMHSALENVYEALVGALYLDAGYTATHEFVLATLGPEVSPALAEKPISPKSRLQEVTQRDLHCGPSTSSSPRRGRRTTPRSPRSSSWRAAGSVGARAPRRSPPRAPPPSTRSSVLATPRRTTSRAPASPTSAGGGACTSSR